MSSPEAQLARVEGTRLLRNPAVWLAIVPTAQWIRSESGSPEDEYLLLVGFGLLLPGLAVLAHLVLAVLRTRSQRTDWLLDAVPVGRDRITVGHGLSTLAGGLLGLAVIVATYLAFRPPLVIGMGDGSVAARFPRPNLAQLLQGPMALVAVSAFAIALVRWVPSWLVLLPLAFLALVQGVALGVFFGEATGSLRTWLWPLSTGVVHGEWDGCGTDDAFCDLPVSGFDQTTPWWHLGYLASLAVVFVAVAVLRHRRDRAAWIALGVSIVAVVAFAIGQAVVLEPYYPPGTFR